jgi:hypothetical protein
MKKDNIAANCVCGAAEKKSSAEWFEFDNATGGWWVNDISRGADSGNTALTGSAADYGHRVQIIPFNEDNLPYAQSYEALLRLPEYNPKGGKTQFMDIARVRVKFHVNWAEWTNPSERANLEVILQDLRSWAPHTEGGNIGEILKDVDPETMSFEDYPNPVFMIAAPKMYEKLPPPSGMETWANYFKVMVTNFALANKFPTPPIKALVHLLDSDGNIIPLTMP